MNKNRFNAMMAGIGDTAKTLSEYLGISETTLSRKKNGHLEFTQREIQAMIVRYSLSPEEVNVIFFDL